MTKQRALILQVIRNNQGHLTAEEIFRQAKLELSSLALGTVYRNLNLMCRDGEIRRLSIPGQPDFFDCNPDLHEHAYCVGCGRLFDITIPGLEPLLREHCSELVSYQLSVQSVCPDCKNQMKHYVGGTHHGA